MKLNVRSSSLRHVKKTRRYRAFLDDVEVTERCFYADYRPGVVGLYVVDEAGNIVVDLARDALREVYKHGKVRLVRRQAA